MAYVNRPKGIGQTTYVGPCQDPTQVMDPTSGMCVSPGVLQNEVSNYQAGTNYLTSLVSQGSSQMSTIGTLAAFGLGAVILLTLMENRR